MPTARADQVLRWGDVERTASAQLGVVQLGLGINILAGGPARFPPPTYGALLEVADGAVWPYGAALVLVGTALLVPWPSMNLAGHLAAIACMNVLGALFMLSMVRDPEAASTAWWVYFSLGTIHGSVLAAAVWHRRRAARPAPGGDRGSA